jgi:hypothetical protein
MSRISLFFTSLHNEPRWQALMAKKQTVLRECYWSQRRPADPGWVSERSSLDQKGRAHHFMPSSAAAFRRRREQGSETRNSVDSSHARFQAEIQFSDPTVFRPNRGWRIIFGMAK